MCSLRDFSLSHDLEPSLSSPPPVPQLFVLLSPGEVLIGLALPACYSVQSSIMSAGSSSPVHPSIAL
jgi:hypothetical protein